MGKRCYKRRHVGADHRSNQHAADHESGFTLLELLVSLVLLALILSFFGGALRFSSRAWETAEALDRGASVRAMRTYLEQRLAEAMPVYERDEAGRVRIAFSGLSQELSFVSPASRGEAGAGLYRYALHLHSAVRTARTGMALALSQTLYRAEVAHPIADTSAEKLLLLENIEGVGFRYFGRKDARTPVAWHSVWTRTDALPELVEVNILLREQDARAWPPLVVELKLRPAP
ncbi:MAG TPA: prepilin-type N-terminal cleavage/methylation domain-containing protein [Hyphomicrobiaceae bacterium]|jgi:prepilin-type N-terminal cleavage/methylation domain-containing protein|nr:prepilin-type N-terminal cleavage/methylation domain-containing protein [Hyphomicrobiaceae bacterium]